MNNDEEFSLEKQPDFSFSDIRDEFTFSGGAIFIQDSSHDITKEIDYQGATTKVVTYKGKHYSYESFLWFCSTGDWVKDFIYLDDDTSNTEYVNLLPQTFVVHQVEFTNEQLTNWFEYDEEVGDLFWYYQKNMGAFWNCIFPLSKANKVYSGVNYVDIFGAFYLSSDVVNLLCHLGLTPPIRHLNGDKSDVRLVNLVQQSGADDPTEVALDDMSDFITEGQYSYDNGDLIADEKVGREKVLSCFYCGDNTSITRDHVIPVSISQNSRNFNYRDTVPCCSECNTLLGNKLLLTVEDRAAYLADKLARRHRSKLAAYLYNETEIAQFGPHLQSMVKANVNQKNFICSRIDRCHQVAGSLYNQQDVAHLRGMTTNAKRTAYGIIEEFIYDKSSTLKEFADQKAVELDADAKTITQIINETLHPDVAIQFKYDNHFVLNVSLRKIKAAFLREK